ncbi:MAG: hypothetical protein M1814_001431 [Vezdaea aestivalis]|nr:MAG: hypothetical protein M1814_001431 [Vezdaea aestivalis]
MSNISLDLGSIVAQVSNSQSNLTLTGTAFYFVPGDEKIVAADLLDDLFSKRCWISRAPGFHIGLTFPTHNFENFDAQFDVVLGHLRTSIERAKLWPQLHLRCCASPRSDQNVIGTSNLTNLNFLLQFQDTFDEGDHANVQPDSPSLAIVGPSFRNPQLTSLERKSRDAYFGAELLSVQLTARLHVPMASGQVSKRIKSTTSLLGGTNPELEPLVNHGNSNLLNHGPQPEAGRCTPQVPRLKRPRDHEPDDNCLINKTVTLFDSAFRSMICSLPQNIPKGIRVHRDAAGPSLTVLAPIMFSPGYIANMAERQLLPHTLAHSLASVLGRASTAQLMSKKGHFKSAATAQNSPERNEEGQRRSPPLNVTKMEQLFWRTMATNLYKSEAAKALTPIAPFSGDTEQSSDIMSSPRLSPFHPDMSPVGAINSWHESVISLANDMKTGPESDDDSILDLLLEHENTPDCHGRDVDIREHFGCTIVEEVGNRTQRSKATVRVDNKSSKMREEISNDGLLMEESDSQSNTSEFILALEGNVFLDDSWTTRDEQEDQLDF